MMDAGPFDTTTVMSGSLLLKQNTLTKAQEEGQK